MTSVLASAIALGDLPSWIGAIATTLGLIAASVAAWFVKGQLDVMKEQADRDRERAEHDREEIAHQRAEWAEADRLRARAQAKQIDVSPGAHIVEMSGIEPATYLTVTVTNRSDGPIRSLRCRADLFGGDQFAQPMNDRLGRIVDLNGPRVMPDSKLRAPLAMLRAGQAVTYFLTIGSPDQLASYKFAVQFEDDSDLWWQRDSDLRLRRAEAAELWPS